MTEESQAGSSHTDHPVGSGGEAEQPTGSDSEQPTGGGSEEELKRRLEEQLRKIRVQDLLLESVASILNLAARRIANAEERDLEQGRIGIEAVRGLVELLEPGPREQVREALSQVQVLYAREAKGGEGEPGEEQPPSRPSGLWTPGGG